MRSSAPIPPELGILTCSRLGLCLLRRHQERMPQLCRSTKHHASCLTLFFVLLAAASLQAVMVEGKYGLPCTSAALLCLSLPFFDCKAKRGHWIWSFTHPTPITEVAHGGCAPPHLPHKPTMCSTCAAPAALCTQLLGCAHPLRVAYAWAWKADCFVQGRRYRQF